MVVRYAKEGGHAMSALRKLYYRVFKRYQRLAFQICTYAEADALIKATYNLPEPQQWHLATEEDHNCTVGVVFMERRERITS